MLCRKRNLVERRLHHRDALNEPRHDLLDLWIQFSIVGLRIFLRLPQAELPHLPDIHHGSVLEGIIAVQHTDKPGTRITAGLLLAKVYRNSDGSYLGGFACEYAGRGSVEEAEADLREAMQQPFARRYKTRFYKLEFGKSVVRTYTPEKSFGTILVGIGFASFLVPVLKPEVEVTPSHKDKSHVKYTTR
jgi:pyruvoyl-dependent arginine decarboxylase (PvlArgDC)